MIWFKVIALKGIVVRKGTPQKIGHALEITSAAVLNLAKLREKTFDKT